MKSLIIHFKYLRFNNFLFNLLYLSLFLSLFLFLSRSLSLYLSLPLSLSLSLSIYLSISPFISLSLSLAYLWGMKPLCQTLIMFYNFLFFAYSRSKFPLFQLKLICQPSATVERHGYRETRSSSGHRGIRIHFYMNRDSYPVLAGQTIRICFFHKGLTEYPCNKFKRSSFWGRNKIQSSCTVMYKIRLWIKNIKFEPINSKYNLNIEIAK